jgi:cell fate regulator YaaT (PSP1 superfamily)
LREEAGRLGGIGSCGRELCCSTWLRDFRVVTTSAARYQQLSLNPQKIAGQCGKLKCCLNFELDQYQEALTNFPKRKTKLKTDKGIAICQKLDIFKNSMWFSYKNESLDWYEIKVDDVKKIIEINSAGKSISKLEDYSIIRESKNEKVFV